MTALDAGRFIASFSASWLASHAGLDAWHLTTRSRDMIAHRIGNLDPSYRVDGLVAVHQEAVVEWGAVIKGPAIISAGCFIAAGAYLRDGCWLDEGCVIGPGTEVKSSYLFRGAKLAHFNFVGDSLVGAGVNFEAGAVIANFRNEWVDPRIILRDGHVRIETGVSKFGAIIGDETKIGANAVVAPGSLLPARTLVPRLGLIDQSAV